MMAEAATRHPCFDSEARTRVARVHLPVAPACNVSCNFCDRKHDCLNESRPGVTSVVLEPWQAVEYLDGLMARRGDIGVVGIAGPGDPMANREATLATLAAVRARHPGMLLCLATNGVALAESVDALRQLGLSHLTITINAIDAATAARIYAWVRTKDGILRGHAAGREIVTRQLDALDALRGTGIVVKVNTVVLPGINDGCVAEIAAEVARRGAAVYNCIPLVPAGGSRLAALKGPDEQTMAALRAATGAFLPAMAHCSRCRADACGLLNEGTPTEALLALRAAAGRGRPIAAPVRPRVAVATREGVLIGGHLGEADALSVFEAGAEGVRFVERRPTPPPGEGDARWNELARQFHDCRTIVVTGVGPGPRRVLQESGIEVLQAEGLLDDALEPLLRGEPLPAHMRRRFAGCGTECSGTGQGCG